MCHCVHEMTLLNGNNVTIFILFTKCKSVRLWSNELDLPAIDSFHLKCVESSRNTDWLWKLPKPISPFDFISGSSVCYSAITVLAKNVCMTSVWKAYMGNTSGNFTAIYFIFHPLPLFQLFRLMQNFMMCPVPPRNAEESTSAVIQRTEDGCKILSIRIFLLLHKSELRCSNKALPKQRWLEKRRDGMEFLFLSISGVLVSTDTSGLWFMRFGVWQTLIL